MPLRFLVTGFGKFAGAWENPTAWLIHELGKNRPRLARLGIELHCAVLPVQFAAVGPALKRLNETLRPGAIVHFGLAARRKYFSIETRALNRLSALHCDASGARAPSRAIIQGASYAMRSRFPCRETKAALQRIGLKSRLSINAGSYVCNETLYLSLARSHAGAIGFIHVPRLRRLDRPRGARQSCRPARTDLVQAALTAILLTATWLRQNPASKNRQSNGPALDLRSSRP